MKKTIRRRLTILCIVSVLFVQNIHPFFVPSANAFTVSILESIPEKLGRLLDFITETLTTVAMSALINGTTYMARKLAYDAAVFVSEGGKGQGKLIYEDGVGEYFLSVTKDAAGEAVSGLGETFGLDLCQIPDPRINVFLQIGLRNIFPDGTEPKPKCSWQDLKNNWGDIGNVLTERYGEGGSKLASHVFNANLSVTQSDFGVAAGAIARVDENQVEAGIAANLERIVNKGVKDVTSLISNKVETPAEYVAHDLKQLTPKEQQDLTAGQIAGLYGSSLKQIPAVAANVFLNTLLSKLSKKLFDGLFPATPDPGAAGGASSFFADSLQNNRRAADRALGFLLAPKIGQINSYEIVDVFAICPESPSLNNCVIDDGLRQLVQRAKQGQPLTIAEAITEGLLNGDRPLISPRHADNSNVKECYLNGYCYSNIQKMRKVRMLPLGFELAALKSDPDSPWTLKQVVDGFNRCNSRQTSDALNPFCQLIDPNWVIKLPQVRCQSLVRGPILIDSGAPVRHEECADVQTCIDEDDNGTCNNWGYCTREKNIWRLGGAECPAHYATCTTYTNTQDRNQLSFLSRTVEFGECSEQSVGCRAYSSEQTDGEWLPPISFSLAERNALSAAGRNLAYHFNKDVQTCSASGEGCTAFYGARRSPAGQFLQAGGQYQKDPGTLIHLKKAPAYLGCYDTNLATPGAEWPETRAQAIQTAGNNAACSNFAGVCAPSEVGCELYTQVEGGGSTQIPGIVSSGDACDARCVGYETFRQEATNFEGSRFPLYFNPRNPGTRQCSESYVGCEEFTNLEAGAVGGEQVQRFSYVRYCEKPTGNNEQTFFSWEGSEQEGYVLRTHRLLIVDQNNFNYINSLVPANLTFQNADTATNVFPIGSPAYNDTSAESLQNKYNACNAAAYSLLINNPFAAGAASADCRALYDNAGNIYYRLLSDTVTVSNQCIRLRKTDSRLYIDEAVTAPNICNTVGGLWGNADNDLTTGNRGNECQRCFGGGRMADGVCVYQTIPAESTQCPAAAVGCRAYAGNTGNVENPRVVFDNFEITASETNAIREALSDWTNDPINVRLVAEALQVGGRSLQVNIPRVERVISAGTLKVNQWYELEFWARGVPQNLSITWAQDTNELGGITFGENNTPDERIAFWNRDLATNQDTTVTVGGEWKRYNLGPVQFTGDSTFDTVMTFERTNPAQGANSRYFLDFVRVGLLQDRLYLIKDSWKTAEGYDVPLVCDANPIDPFPGAALGCSAYNDTQGNQVFVTGFSSLCREAAVGCQPVFDSHNTVGEERAKVFNLSCAGQSGSVCRLTVNGTEIGSCRVLTGLSSCNIAEAVLPSGSSYAGLSAAAPDAITASTIYIPSELDADGDPNPPLFLTNRNEFRCRDSERGCQKLGLQEQFLPEGDAIGIRHSDVYAINDPEKYIRTDSSGVVTGGVLCREQVLGCGEFRADGNTVYFKDPKYTGNSVCEYRSDVDINGTKFSGWFRKGLGICSNNGNRSCQADADCGEGNTCQTDTPAPCYANNVSPGNVYGIWSNQSANYRGFAGECPATENRCTELLDPLDRSARYPQGQPYYRINDNRLTEDASACRGQVSLKEGCVLFDRTDQPTKLWSTNLTYARSDASTPRYSPVEPVRHDDAARNDANLLLKVDRDRACAEWLACRNSVVVTGEDGQKQLLCSQYQACDRTISGKECVSYVTPELDSRLLDERKYTSRDVSWFGRDYSGYSLLDRYQITDYIYLNFPGDNNQYLAYRADPRFFAPRNDQLDPTQSDFTGLGCAPSAETTQENRQDRDWQPCGLDGEGRCYNDHCVYPIEQKPGSSQFDGPASPVGTTEEQRRNNRETNLNIIKESITGPSCKGFPEDSSPFPDYLAKIEGRSSNSGIRATEDTVSTTIREGDLLRAEIQGQVKERRVFSDVNRFFQNANFCQSGNCSCNYKKYIYDNGTADYTSSTPGLSTFVADGICTGGTRDGFPCGSNGDCNNEGVCSRLKTIETHVGLTGFCLEPDLSRPINGVAAPGRDRKQEYACLTWLPIQTSASRVDLLNRNLEAGYYPQEGFDGPDSPGVGGELYCAAIDRGGLFDLAYLRSRGLSDNQAQTFISPGSQTNLNNNIERFFGRQGDHYNCDLNTNSDNNSPYFIIMCANASEQKTSKAYTMLQQYAWQKFGSSAVLLRAELSPHGTRGNSNFAGPNQHTRKFFPANEDMEGGRNGLYNFTQAPQFINENTIEDVYIIPLMYTQTARGLLPKTMNELQHPEVGISDGNTLRIPVGAFRRGEIQNNGQLYPIQGVSAFAGDFGDGERFNFSAYGDYNPADSTIPDWFTKLKDPVGLKPVWGGNNHLYVWRYMHDRNTRPEPSIYSEVPNSSTVAKRYVIVFFSREGLRDYGGDNRFNTLRPVFANAFSLGAIGTVPDDNIPARAPVGTAEDPFAEDCAVGFQNTNGDDSINTSHGNADDRHGNPWLAVALNFAEDGTFLGYSSRWCSGYNQTPHDNATRGGGANFAVIATLNNQCTEYVQVYDDGAGNPLIETTNKAWTNRVWRGALQSDGSPYNHPLGTYGQQGTNRPFRRNSAMVPFASVALDGSLLSTLNSRANQNSLLNYVFTTPNTQGIPYSCQDAVSGASRYVDLLSIFGCPFVQNSSYRLIGGVDTVLRSNSPDVARDALFQLFALQFTRARLTANRERYSNDSSIDASDVPEDRAGKTGTSDGFFQISRNVGTGRDAQAEQLRVPTVFSLNPTTCFTEGSLCTAAEPNSFTVNQRNQVFPLKDYDDDGRFEEDANRDGVPDEIIGREAESVSLQFFAIADDNRMPIRNVAVDWGDGEENISPPGRNPDSPIGLYKNRKPFCSQSNTETAPSVGLCAINDGVAGVSNLTCRRDADCPGEWVDRDVTQNGTCITPAQLQTRTPADRFSVPRFGNAPRACTPDRFEFVHDYICNKAIVEADNPVDYVVSVANLPQATQNRLTGEFNLGLADGVCVFRPRVHVKDNWGYCNGSCPDGPAGACYDGGRPYGLGNDNCNYEIVTDNTFPDYPWADYNGIISDPEPPAGLDYPWTNYKGLIIVVPSEEE